MLVESCGEHIDLKWKGTIVFPCNSDFTDNDIICTTCVVMQFYKETQKY